ncbi:unnamed protein product [Acanthoscelides obtectus]|uniref:Uncharacterized protein n=1 Tax=Acanthoscelides obtectus TaxID=200917 RepID=A0A9P0MJ66_ACAOB|nr:unnamed protein product [Acanthoscelides obtectus]CAK1654892.1 hypothetical protein AOBTE_LOCUS18913 [Acanthoscelides obtectus]
MKTRRSSINRCKPYLIIKKLISNLQCKITTCKTVESYF